MYLDINIYVVYISSSIIEIESVRILFFFLIARP